MRFGIDFMRMLLTYTGRLKSAAHMSMPDRAQSSSADEDICRAPIAADYASGPMADSTACSISQDRTSPLLCAARVLRPAGIFYPNDPTADSTACKISHERTNPCILV